MVATILIVVGVLTGVLGISDRLLSDSQKKYLNDRVIRLWMKLDDARRISLLRWLLNPERRRWFTAAALLGAFGLTGYFLLQDGPELDRVWLFLFGCMAVAALIGITVGWLMHRHILSRSQTGAIFWSAAYFTATYAVAIPVIVLSGFTMAMIQVGVLWSEAPADWSLVGALLVTVYSVLIVCIFLAVAALPLYTVVLLQGCLFVVEFFIRRIAEAPGGIVGAISGLLTAAGGILKALQ